MLSVVEIMVLLAYLKFCWRVLIFAGVVLGQNKGIFWRTASKILLAVRQKIPALPCFNSKRSNDMPMPTPSLACCFLDYSA